MMRAVLYGNRSRIWCLPAEPRGADGRAVSEAMKVERALADGRLAEAQAIVFHWLHTYFRSLPAKPSRKEIRHAALWTALADVVERTSDQYLVELFWQGMDGLGPSEAMEQELPAVPLLIVPILNRPDLLKRLLNSIDHPVQTLAIIDNSRGSANEAAVRTCLDQLEQAGHPQICAIEIARPFGNLGVAASWNLALRAFPACPASLIVNNDITFAPGLLAEATHQINTTRPEFLPLMPPPQEFSAFLITALCWNRIGLFDPAFHPAYCEDLDYRDRLRADPGVRWLQAPALQQAMAACNREHSTTIGSDPALAERNRASFALNRLWWLSHRRLRHDPRGTWLRQWLTEWKD